MKLLIGMVLGGLTVWLYMSERGRSELRRRFATAPESVEHLRHTLASATAAGAQRISEAIDSAPLADPVKDTASEAAFNVWAAADKLGQSTPEPEVRASGDPRAES
jgi:hypothetical protein